MGFDLTTFLAQILNLFLLIWILRHFLYRPVLAAIEKRRQRIIHSIREADDKLALAEQEKKTLNKLKENFEQQRQKRLDDLDLEIQQYRAQMMQEVEADYKLKQQKLQATLDTNWQSAQNTIQQMVGEEFISLAQKILTEWSNQTPEDQMLQLFDKKVHTLSNSKKKQIQALLKQQKSIYVLTSTLLTQQQKNVLRNILLKYFILPEKMRIQYKKGKHILLGLEIHIGHFLLDWNLNTYLDEMNQHLKQGISDLIVPIERKAEK